MTSIRLPPYLRVNPGYPGSITSKIGRHPRNMNCVNCVIAIDRMLAGGGLQLALPDLIGGSVLEIEDLYERQFIDVYSHVHIEILLQLAGAGARGIVYGEITVDLGHAINVVNLGKEIIFIDGQSGRFYRTLAFKNLALLRTN